MKERVSVMEKIKCCGKSTDHTKMPWKCLEIDIKNEKQALYSDLKGGSRRCFEKCSTTHGMASRMKIWEG